jgi:hypothetical protein
MSDPLRQSPNDTARGPRAAPEDPLEELARILGETAAPPVRPENVGEVGRRATPTLPMPQQLSALEVELFDELRSSVTPESRVRGTFEPEQVAVRPQQPADDHDIAALRIDPPAPAESPAGRQLAVPAEETQGEVPWSDYYGWDDGVAAGSYDPAFAGGEGRGPAEPGEFGREEIARAAAEADPYAVPPAVVAPRSERPAPRLDTGRRSGLGRRLGIGLVLLVVVAGGAWAGLKYLPGMVGASGPTLIRADGKPLKVVPDPKAPVSTDNRPNLTPDPASGASRIVSLQEDPVDQVSGRTPEGKEVRVINPGVQRAGSDQPHTVKTVVVRPDGTVVSDGAVQPPRPTAVRTTAIGPDGRPIGGAPAAEPPVSAQPPIQLQLPPGGQPLVSAQPPIVAPPPVAAAPAAAGTPISVPLPVEAPTRSAAAAPVAPVAPAPVATAPVVRPPAPTAVVPPPAPRAPTPPPVAAVRPAPATPGAPLSLSSAAGAPRVAAAQPAPAAPVAVAPAAAGSGDWVVQIAATKSDADARKSYADAQRRYSALAGRPLDVQQANLGDRGVFYRARVPAGSREQAVALCEQLKSQGGQCLVAHR